MLMKIAVAVLFLLVAAGLYGALSLSYTTLTGEAPCPSLSVLPICYLVAAAYVAMLIGLSFSQHPLSSPLFVVGWALVFGVAAIGAYLELQAPGSCSASNSGIPMCYLSLGLSLVIIALYLYLREHLAGAR